MAWVRRRKRHVKRLLESDSVALDHQVRENPRFSAQELRAGIGATQIPLSEINPILLDPREALTEVETDTDPAVMSRPPKRRREAEEEQHRVYLRASRARQTSQFAHAKKAIRAKFKLRYRGKPIGQANRKSLGQINVEELGCPESQATITGQLLILRDIVVSGEEGMPSSRKWFWTGDFGKSDPIKGAASTVAAGTRRALTVKIPGAFLHPLDADIEDSQHLSGADLEAIQEKQYSHTWAVPNEDLEAIVSAMYESLDPALVVRLLPKHGKSDNFPYSDSRDVPVFIVPSPTELLTEKQQCDSEKIDCYQCHLPIKRDDARAHAGGHILRVIRGFPEPGLFEMVSIDDPCGFCGRSGCRVELSKAGKSFKMASTCA
ncbi:hypothetical protein C8J57DRAFT_1235753 [Mycena rebaudengoi]|nr:hypothetical protein C8J57DRAFT_1235753 [Mycena rebaudengoi]